MYFKILLLIAYSVTALNILKTQFKLGSFYQIKGNQQDLLQIDFEFAQQVDDPLQLIIMDHETQITSLNLSVSKEDNNVFNYQVKLTLEDGVEIGKYYIYKLRIGDEVLRVESFYIPNKSEKRMEDVQILPGNSDVLNTDKKNYSIILIQDQDIQNIYYFDDQDIQLESIYYLNEYDDSLQGKGEQVVINQKQEQYNQRLLQQYNGQPCQPYGMRLTLGYYYTYKQDSNDMMDIAFNTLEYCPHSYIIISDDFDYEAIIPVGEIRILNMTQIYENFTGINYNYTTYINIIRLGSQNIPGDDRIYTYTIFGDVGGDSAGPFMFKIPSKAHNNKERRFMFFGDMDSQWIQNNSNYTFNFLQAKTNRQNIEYYDTMTFLGDMAYDLESYDCSRGDQWLRNISIFTAYYPFMVIPGNHDSGNNSDYPYIRRAFLSPKNHLDSQTYYNDFVSYDLGLVHFVSFNPDWIVYQTAPEEYIQFVYELFVKDFEKAQANRDQVPWIIVQNHYPMYCSDDTNWMCGTNWVTLEQFSNLFTQYNVEVFMSAHQHSYERDSPFINNQTASFETDGPQQHVIKNSNAPVYIIEGAAGNDYFMPSENYPTQPYTVAQSIVDGVGVITVYNATHLLFEHIISETGEVADYVWVIQEEISPSPDIALIIAILIAFLIFAILICLCFFRRRDSLRAELLP